MESLNGKPIWFSSGGTHILYSDAGSSGFGGYAVELGNDIHMAVVRGGGQTEIH